MLQRAILLAFFVGLSYGQHRQPAEGSSSVNGDTASKLLTYWGFERGGNYEVTITVNNLDLDVTSFPSLLICSTSEYDEYLNPITETTRPCSLSRGYDSVFCTDSSVIEPPNRSNDTSFTLTRNGQFETASQYRFYFGNCDRTSIDVDFDWVFTNTDDNRLPYQYFGYAGWYIFLAVVYLIVAVYWVVNKVMNKYDKFKLHNKMLIIFFVKFGVALAWGIVYVILRNSPFPQFVDLIVDAVLTIFLIIPRLMVFNLALLVAWGYGIVTVDLPPAVNTFGKIGLIAQGIGYWLGYWLNGWAFILTIIAQVALVFLALRGTWAARAQLTNGALKESDEKETFLDITRWVLWAFFGFTIFWTCLAGVFWWKNQMLQREVWFELTEGAFLAYLGYKLALRSVNRYHLTYDEINSGAGNGTGGGGGGGKKKKKEKGGDVEMTGGPADDGDDFEYVPRKTPLSAQRASKKGGADPSALWEECYTDDGEVYYYNTKTAESVWEKPY